MALEREIDYYHRNQAEFLKHYENQFVLIKDETLAGTYTTELQAYEAGLAHYGNQPFLIRQVLKEEPVAHFPALSLGLINVHL
jgi:hypothetical protein